MKFGRLLIVGMFLSVALVGCQSASDVSDKDVKSWASVKDKDGKPANNAAAPNVNDER